MPQRSGQPFSPKNTCPLPWGARIGGVLLLAAALGACNTNPDYDGDGFRRPVDCNDADPAVNPDAVEVCDEIDNDCDGEIDGDADEAQLWYIDYDGDGFGSDRVTQRRCDRAEGFVLNGEDCDDLSVENRPGADERCDFVDNDCDGQVDEANAVDVAVWYEDADHDGHGATNSSQRACDQPTGYVGTADDCDDSSEWIFQGAQEQCDGVDNDCDGVVDEATSNNADWWFEDNDADGYGDAKTGVLACVAPEGSVADPRDCDDTEPTVNVGMDEICGDGLDNDCDQSANGCDLSGELSLADALPMVGAAAYDAAGTTVAGAEDLNGDGALDLLVGVPGDDTRGSSAGAVAVIYGPLKTEIALGDLSAVLLGDGKNDKAGSALAGGGDADLDGYPDILVGAPYEDTTDDDAGIAYVAYGPISGTYKLQVADAQLPGELGEDLAGSAVAWAGDVDRDGAADLLVGAPGSDWDGEDAGAAYLVYGPVTGVISLDQSDATFLGYGDGASAGQAVARAGDVDRDGFDDLLVGAPLDDGRAETAGAAYLVYGPVSDTLSLPHSAAGLPGEQPGDAAGYAVAGVGDANHDGYDDVLIGAPGADAIDTDAGAAYLLYGPISPLWTLASAGAVLRGEEAKALVGAAVSGPGDVNGDGYDDLAIGARGSDLAGSDAGAVFLVYGPATGSVDLEVADAILLGVAAGDQAGFALGSVGDVDGAGYADLLIGAPGADVGATSAGAAYLVLGSGQ